MLKNMLVAVATVCGGLAALPAMAAPAIKCDPAVIQVSDSGAKVAQYTVQCSADGATIAPSVTFTGEVPVLDKPPYPVTASYRIDSRSAHAIKTGQQPFADQIKEGRLVSSTLSVAALPSQFSGQTEWDASNNVMSIQERPGVWRVYSVRQLDISGDTIVDAGVASTPFKNGKAEAYLNLGKEFSRFAAKGAAEPVLKAQLGLRDGKLEVLVGETRAHAEAALKNALLQLDKRPKDVTRAWTLAALAQFLGLEDEVRYAEQKVAAFNPQLLAEFHQGVERIKPYTLNQAAAAVQH